MEVQTVLWLVAACVVSLLLVHWAIEYRRLRRFVDSVVAVGQPEAEAALRLAGMLSNRTHRWDDPPYLNRRLASFGATPSALIEEGGCCSGTSRLYILSLAVLGVRSYQITFYHESGAAQHCLVEVHLPDHPVIVDPVYGVYFTDLNGAPVGLEDLQRGERVEYRPLPGALSPGYPDDEYYAFDFGLTKTANWTATWQRRAVYAVLTRVIGRRVDRLRVPTVLEWPQVLLALSVTGGVSIETLVVRVATLIA